MSLSQALASAMSGLRANQVALGLVSSNVGNAETPGYVRKTATQGDPAVWGMGAPGGDGTPVRLARNRRNGRICVRHPDEWPASSGPRTPVRPPIGLTVRRADHYIPTRQVSALAHRPDYGLVKPNLWVELSTTTLGGVGYSQRIRT